MKNNQTKNNQTAKPQDQQTIRLSQGTQESTLSLLSLSELDDNQVCGGLGYSRWW
ncbi:hypothetical protein [Moorena producens]|uniref:hypothetical protein n=1 Tax=Moorena producens TaxID=1155739 RepID=UPI0013143C9C|nr:hypothetical protein [Moorena producens]